MKQGDVVNVYMNPIEEKNLISSGTLVKKIEEKGEYYSRKLEMWEIDFGGEKGVFPILALDNVNEEEHGFAILDKINEQVSDRDSIQDDIQDTMRDDEMVEPINEPVNESKNEPLSEPEKEPVKRVSKKKEK